MPVAQRCPLLEVKGLKKHFPIEVGFRRKVVGHVRAVDGVSFTVNKGETLGLVGESGSGKTTIGLTIMRGYEPTEGTMTFYTGDRIIDIGGLSKNELKDFRRNAQMVFQDPFSSLNPRMTIKDIIGEPLLVNRIASGKRLERMVVELMGNVGLRREYLSRYPHAFSGGQRQRIAIARALALSPDLILADEPVSALDVSIQAQILNLFGDLQEELGLAYLFVAHDLSVVEYISHRVAVMYVGKLVESARTENLFGAPKHPYTEALLKAIPRPDPRRKVDRTGVQGEIPDPSNPPSGCVYHPRCMYAQDVCIKQEPVLRNLGGDDDPHYVACHFPLNSAPTGTDPTRRHTRDR